DASPMTAPHPANGPPARNSLRLDGALDRFEEAWEAGPAPSIEDFLRLAAAPELSREELLKELIKIDLEHRWRGRAAGPPPDRPRLEAYLERYPELARREILVLDLLGEEYRTRQRWGDRPDHGEFTTRFARLGTRVAESLARIDRELRDEFAGEGGR